MLREVAAEPAGGPGCRVLAGGTSAVLDAYGSVLGQLTPSEEQRAGALVFERDRDDFRAAHVLARVAVGRLVGSSGAVALEQVCPSCGGPHGPPRVVGRPEVFVSWSHTRGHVAAAAGFAPVGVDVEPLAPRPPLSESLVATVLSSAERDRLAAAADPEAYFLRQWVRKECLVKLGRLDLDRLPEVGFDDLEPADPRSTPAWRSWRDLSLLDWEDDGVCGAAAVVRSGADLGRHALSINSSDDGN